MEMTRFTQNACIESNVVCASTAAAYNAGKRKPGTSQGAERVNCCSRIPCELNLFTNRRLTRLPPVYQLANQSSSYILQSRQIRRCTESSDNVK